MFSTRWIERRLIAPAGRIAESWVNPRLGEGAERTRQERMLAALLLAAVLTPAPVAVLAALLLDPAASPGIAIAFSGTLLLAAAALSLTASRVAAASAAFAIAAAFLGFAWAGGAGIVILAAAFAGCGASGFALLQTLLPGAPVADVLVQPTGIKLGLEAMPGLVTVHDAKGVVTEIGGAERERLAGRLKLKLGTGLVEQIHVADRLAFMQAFDRLRQGAHRAEAEYRLARPGVDAGFAPMQAEMVALRDEDGVLAGVLVQSLPADVEVALRAERDLLIEKAAGADSEKTRFLAAVSHELRTPLNAIIGFSDILAHGHCGTLVGERQREYVDLIRSSGGHLLSVVNTMLDTSKIEAGRYRLRPESFVVKGVVDECVAMLGLDASRQGLTLTARVARDVKPLTADRHALKQMLINLIANAVKFTDVGGAISVDALCLGSTMRLTVADTGVGMEPHVLKSVGRPFVQGERDYARHQGGTGLGLCLVEGLTRLHGGTLSIDSVAGRGTAVTIDLPLDGSGIVTEEDMATSSVAVFPPRLKETDEAPLRQEAGNDATKKTA